MIPNTPMSGRAELKDDMLERDGPCSAYRNEENSHLRNCESHGDQPFPFFALPPEIRNMIFSYPMKDSEDHTYDTAFTSPSGAAKISISKGVATNVTLVSRQFRKEYLEEVSRSTSLTFSGRPQEWLRMVKMVGAAPGGNLHPIYTRVQHIVLTQSVMGWKKRGPFHTSPRRSLLDFTGAISRVLPRLKQIDLYLTMSHSHFAHLCEKRNVRFREGLAKVLVPPTVKNVKVNVHCLMSCHLYRLRDGAQDNTPDTKALPVNVLEWYKMLPTGDASSAWFGIKFEKAEEHVAGIAWLADELDSGV